MGLPVVLVFLFPSVLLDKPTKMLSAVRVAATTRPFLRVARCYSGGHHGLTLKEQCEDNRALMDLLPTPEGDYKTKMKEKHSTLLCVAAYFASLKSGTHTVPDWSIPKDYNIYE